MIYLDMDGVLCDFVGGVCKAHNLPNPYADVMNHGQWDIWKLWDMPIQQFWEPCEYDFWANLEPTPEFHKLVGENQVHAIITSPSQNAGCIPGKIAWVKRHCPHLRNSIIFTHAKHLVAGSGRTLIDDNDANCEMWREAGGVAVQVPRPWNSLHGIWNEDRRQTIYIQGKLS